MAIDRESADDPNLAALVLELITHLERWAMLRWRLAQVQAHQALVRVQRGLIFMIFAMLTGLLGALALVVATTMALATVLPSWAAAGIVGVVLSVLGTALFVSARRELTLSEPPRTGLEILEDATG